MNEKADSEGKWVWGSLSNLLSHIATQLVLPIWQNMSSHVLGMSSFFLPHYYPHQMQPWSERLFITVILIPGEENGHRKEMVESQDICIGLVTFCCLLALGGKNIS